MSLKHDLHLSAYKISPESIAALTRLGFVRDSFANNTRCDTTIYHGTYRGSLKLPDDSLWNAILELLDKDNQFIGGLEEEEFDPSKTVYFTNDSNPESGVSSLPCLPSFRPDSGAYKACDIHINIDMNKIPLSSLAIVEELKAPSFDKDKDSQIHRIFSLTCDRAETGHLLFAALARMLKRIPGLQGKMKYERTIRFYRKPLNAPALPLSRTDDCLHWLTLAKSL